MSEITNPYAGIGVANLTTEADAWPLIPEEQTREIISGVVEQSSALSLFRRLPNMTSKIRRMLVLDALGGAAFTSGTTDDALEPAYETPGPEFYGEKGLPNEDMPGMKSTHQMKWSNVYINAEEIAIILPIGEDVLDDATYPIWDEIRPRIVEAFHQAIDRAVIWGQARPENWPVGIVPAALGHDQVIVEGANADNVDVADDVADVMAILEELGYEPTGFIAAMNFRNQLRKLRDTNDALLFQPSLQSGLPATLHGLPINFPRNNVFYPDVARLICGDTTQAVYAIRRDIDFRVFTEGVIQDTEGHVIFNLMQNDMVALRVRMHLGWAVPNPIHAMREDRLATYPFALLAPPVVES